jgi:hypothetical protein
MTVREREITINRRRSWENSGALGTVEGPKIPPRGNAERRLRTDSRPEEHRQAIPIPSGVLPYPNDPGEYQYHPGEKKNTFFQTYRSTRSPVIKLGRLTFRPGFYTVSSIREKRHPKKGTIRKEKPIMSERLALTHSGALRRAQRSERAAYNRVLLAEEAISRRADRERIKELKEIRAGASLGGKKSKERTGGGVVYRMKRLVTLA